LDTNQLLKEGKLLPLMEEFYTLQGEGTHTGKAAWFIRIGGCDVGCRWCDVKESWIAGYHPLTSTDAIIAKAAKCAAKAVVVTGGEPLLCQLDYLCAGLKKEGIKTYLETSGSEKLSGAWDWICLSPKRNAPPLAEIFQLADELKVIVYDDDDFDWAEANARFVRKECRLLLQPEWSRYKTVTPRIVDYILKHPQWGVSLQSHKFMRIP